jgi:hypothetical protein
MPPAARRSPSASLIGGWECKFYAGTLDKGLGRAFVELVDDMGKVYALLWIREHSPTVYEHVVEAGSRYTANWDMPEHSKKEIEGVTKMAEWLGTRKADTKPSQ